MSNIASAPATGPADLALDALMGKPGRIPASIFAGERAAVRAPGLYAWFADESGATQLSRGLGHHVAPGLIYAGQAGAGTSTATLGSRIRGNHLGGTITGSTFRMTLASLLVDDLGLLDLLARALAGEGEAQLRAWMLGHLDVAVFAEPDRTTLRLLEAEVLSRLDPPLNLQGMPPSPVRAALSSLRRRPLGGRT